MDVWDMFFMSVAGWQYHPGNKENLTLEECAAVADEMMKLRDKQRLKLATLGLHKWALLREKG